MKEIYSELFLGAGRELQLAACALMVGGIMGIVYDIFRAIRLAIAHNRWAVMLEDIIFTLFFGIIYYTFSVELTKGSMRFFVLVGMLLGLAIYLDSVGRIINGISLRVLKSLRKLMVGLVKIAKKICQKLCGMPFFHKLTKKSAGTSCRTEQGDV